MDLKEKDFIGVLKNLKESSGQVIGEIYGGC
jgi:hypothetical protein